MRKQPLNVLVLQVIYNCPINLRTPLSVSICLQDVSCIIYGGRSFTIPDIDVLCYIKWSDLFLFANFKIIKVCQNVLNQVRHLLSIIKICMDNWLLIYFEKILSIVSCHDIYLKLIKVFLVQKCVYS